MFDTSLLYKNTETPLCNAVIAILHIPNKNDNGYTMEKITYNMCKNNVADSMKKVLLYSYHKLVEPFWHDLIIKYILKYIDWNLQIILDNNLICFTNEIYCALVYKNPYTLNNLIPIEYQETELFEDALYKPIDYVIDCYLHLYNINRKRRYLEDCIFGNKDNMKYVKGCTLSCLKHNEITYEIEKKLCEYNPLNILYSNILVNYTDDIIDVIKHDKRVLFTINKSKLNYKIIFETIKMYGNYIFINPITIGTINENIPYYKLFIYKFTENHYIDISTILSMNELQQMKNELKEYFIENKHTRKYFKLMRHIDIIIKYKYL